MTDTKRRLTEKDIFETVPVPRAVFTLAVPTVISQLITVIYNLADTFFIGQLGDPYMIAAVSLVSPWFNLLTALGNLFGIGGSSLISRLLGAGRRDEVKQVSAFSLYGGIIVTACFALITLLGRNVILTSLGASADSLPYASGYVIWVVSIGGIPTMLGILMAHLLRSEGHAKQASLGLMLGGVLNAVLDPVFIFALDLGVTGAAMATAISNTVSALFLGLKLRGNIKGRTTEMSFLPKYFTLRHAKDVFSVGLASALATTLANVSNMVMGRLAAGYGDITVAAYGIVKKIDLFPLNASMGLCQGVMPLIGYNYASGDHERMKKISFFAWKTAVGFSALCVICFWLFSTGIVHVFIPEENTAAMGAKFLRLTSMAIPLTSMNFLISYTLQAMGKGTRSAMITSCRQGLLHIPLLIIMDMILGVYGLMCAKLVVEIIMLPIALTIYRRTLKKAGVKI